MKQYCRDSLQTDRGIGRTTKVDFRRRSFEGAGGARIQEAVYSASFLMSPQNCKARFCGEEYFLYAKYDSVINAILLNLVHVKYEKISQFHFTLPQRSV